MITNRQLNVFKVNSELRLANLKIFRAKKEAGQELQYKTGLSPEDAALHNAQIQPQPPTQRVGQGGQQ